MPSGKKLASAQEIQQLMFAMKKASEEFKNAKKKKNEKEATIKQEELKKLLEEYLSTGSVKERSDRLNAMAATILEILTPSKFPSSFENLSTLSAEKFAKPKLDKELESELTFEPITETVSADLKPDKTAVTAAYNKWYNTYLKRNKDSGITKDEAESAVALAKEYADYINKRYETVDKAYVKLLVEYTAGTFTGKILTKSDQLNSLWKQIFGANVMLDILPLDFETPDFMISPPNSNVRILLPGDVIKAGTMIHTAHGDFKLRDEIMCPEARSTLAKWFIDVDDDAEYAYYSDGDTIMEVETEGGDK